MLLLVVRFMRACGVGLVLACLFGASGALADAQFDPPVKLVTVPSTGNEDQVRCTYYTGLMVRESATDTPGPDDAVIFPRSALPACDRHVPPGGIELPSQGQSFTGRKGDFLMFVLTDPTGASEFEFYDARNGHLLFKDGSDYADGWLKSIEVSNGALRMTYTRGINTDCSLLTGGAQCWEQVIESGQIPRGAFAAPPPGKICEASYRADMAFYHRTDTPEENEDPSILLYDAALVLDLAGHARVRPLSGVRCEPRP
jgi:hypothetical protein